MLMELRKKTSWHFPATSPHHPAAGEREVGSGLGPIERWATPLQATQHAAMHHRQLFAPGCAQRTCAPEVSGSLHYSLKAVALLRQYRAPSQGRRPCGRAGMDGGGCWVCRHRSNPTWTLFIPALLNCITPFCLYDSGDRGLLGIEWVLAPEGLWLLAVAALLTLCLHAARSCCTIHLETLAGLTESPFIRPRLRRRISNFAADPGLLFEAHVGNWLPGCHMLINETRFICYTSSEQVVIFEGF